MANYVLLFIIFSVLGYILQALYQFVRNSKLMAYSFLPFFSPTYGLGGIALVLIFKFLEVNPVLQILVGWVVLVLLELLAGLFDVHVLKKKYWDYSRDRWNFRGYIDVEHSINWLVLAIVFRLIFPYLPL